MRSTVSLILFIRLLLPFLSFSHFQWFCCDKCETVSTVKEVQKSPSLYSERSFQKKKLKRLERSNKVRIRTDFSFPACRLTVIGCHSHVCSSWRHFIWMYSLSSLLHQRAQEISLVWISSRIRSSPGSSRVSLGSSLPSYDYFAKNEPIPCPVCIFRSCSALLRPLPNNSDKHTFILGCERLCFSWLTV